MIRWASGSIQVVTKVARLRAGSPSSAMSSPTRRIASTGDMPLSGNVLVGTSRVRNRLPNNAALAAAGLGVSVTLRHHPTHRGPASPGSGDTGRGRQEEPFSSSVLKPSSSRTVTPSCSAFSALEPGLSPTTT